jgi:hypothetical protein
MEKIEKNLITTNQKKGKNLIKATTILEITLEDYHQSRKLYGGNSSNINFENKDNNNPTSDINKYKDENLFDEFEDESNDLPNKRISFSKIDNKDSGKNNNLPKQDVSNKNQPTKNNPEKINKLKNIISTYIKEKELDM